MTTTKGQVRGHRGETLGVRKPLCGYLRLTVDRHGNKIGYDVQKAAIQRWADYAGETIGHWYQDKDITAADRNKERPEYEEMLGAVEAGIWGGIAVWRLDRLVRLMFEIERCFRLVEDADAFIVSIDPTTIDSRDPLGKIFMRILVMFAEMEIETMKARGRGHRKERARQGLYNGGGPRPYGFEGPIREDPEDPDSRIVNSGRIGIAHVPEEIERLRAAAYRIAYGGVKWAEIIEEWHTETPPAYGATGKPWAVWTLQRVLTGPRAIGKREASVEDPETGEEIRALVKAQWDPILDEKTWRRLNTLVTKIGGRGKMSYLLSGLVRCGRCGMPLTGAKRRYKVKGVMRENPTYRCKSGPEDKAKGSCGALNVIAQPVDMLVVGEVLLRLRNTPEFLQTLEERTDEDEGELTAALATIEECDEQLEQVARIGVRQKWTDRQFEAAEEEIALAKVAALRTVDRISRKLSIPIPSPEHRDNLVVWFEGLTLAQKQSLLRAIVRRVDVRATGRSGPVFDKSRVVIALADPHEVNRGGQASPVGDADGEALLPVGS